MMNHQRVLLVDDEPTVRFAMRAFLEAHGFDVREAATCREAEEAFRADRPDIAVLDHVLSDGNALDLLHNLRAVDPGVPLLVLTAHASIDLAVQVVKEGAENFLTKPVDLPALLVILERTLERHKERQHLLAKTARQDRGSPDPFRGTSAAIRSLAEQVRRVVSADSPILIQGETGTGKSVLASWIHRSGPRAGEMLVDLNCAGLSREFLETELFGHEKGAFTGASSAKPGLLELGDKGTLFLDEIGDLDPEVQPKLLKVIEEKRFRRLGDVRDRRVDIALIAATHQDLGALMKQKKFRSDLYFRISTLQLVVPSLRDRVEDIPLLAEDMLRQFAARRGRGDLTLAADAQRALCDYPWPGNLRELRNVIERAVLLSGTSVLTRKDLRFDTQLGDDEPDVHDLTLKELERRHIERVLRDEQGHVERAAARLGVPKSSLYEKLKRYGIRTSRT